MDQPGTSNGPTNGSAPTPLVGEAAKETFLSLFTDCYYPESMLTVTGELGFGSYAHVFKCTLDDGKSTREVAVKKMKPELFQQKQDVLDFFREAELLNSARRAGHENILKFIGVTFGALEEGTEESMCIIEECMNNGTLKSLIETTLQQHVLKRQNKPQEHEEISSKEFLDLVLQVARGLSFLHDWRVMVIHRDIKPSNILINKDAETGKLTAKVSDFGLSVLIFSRKNRLANASNTKENELNGSGRGKRGIVKTVSALREFADAFISSRRKPKLGRGSNSLGKGSRGLQEFYSLTSQTGSLAYMAPEVKRGDNYNHKADVFSFAILAYEALNLFHPFLNYMLQTKGFSRFNLGEEDDDNAAMQEYATKVENGYRPTFTKKWPEQLAKLISDCWNQNPDARPCMSTVVTRLEEIYDNCQSDDVFNKPKMKLRFCLCLLPKI